MLETSLATAPSPEAASQACHEAAFFKSYQPQHKLRFITATALFDGHDASINIIRRLLQMRGAEVIHLGHNRTAQEVAQAAIQEDAQGVAVSSYQGGHMEYYGYLRQLLDQEGGQAIKLFGGGGGVISFDEITSLQAQKIARVYSPEDGQRLGLEGMIGHMLWEANHKPSEWGAMAKSRWGKLARAITLLENREKTLGELKDELAGKITSPKAPVLGLTGTGGAGKSSLLDELLLRFLYDFPHMQIGVICVDPSKKKTGGALLGDRIRINSCRHPHIYLRSLASRGSGRELASVTSEAVDLMQTQGFHLIIVETSGIGQGDTGVLDIADVSLYVMTPEYGASTQLEKIDMLDFADLIAINKYERRQGPDALRDLQTTLRRSRFQGIPPKGDDYPIFATIASRYNDDGTSGLYRALVAKLKEKGAELVGELSSHRAYQRVSSNRQALIPAERENYLADIAKTVRAYHRQGEDELKHIGQVDALAEAARSLEAEGGSQLATAQALRLKAEKIEQTIHPQLIAACQAWDQLQQSYRSGKHIYQVRDRQIVIETAFTSLAGLSLPRVALPHFRSRVDLAAFLLKENLPGSFPFTAGIFPFRRREEDPKRQFAGEGGPARTNKRFHYLCQGDRAKRLSTAFDSVTLYGSEPDKRPDIYGKVGESGVSIAHLDDMRQLYAGFDLCDPMTSVSMTINGPAPIILAMFLNTAIDQQIEQFSRQHQRLPSPSEHQDLYDQTLKVVRGTVQADILKEDQAQNTCIFSSEFALKLMGDIQEYFIAKQVRNYYGVSISGYHIAEAGANPISQLAFTLANGFTYVEYYLARGFAIDDFSPNLSFFFSNGLDAEYAVLGRVARRIWAVAMRERYGASERSQKLKYHIQTSGRSLHAQEMAFNDIRTTLQALLALYDNCNSLHTNAYDEAVTTPTEESVRRAMAIQLVINQEFGPNKCENINQGSYFLSELTDLVEEAVLQEFERLSSRGGVLGAMETQYQRSKIQEESMLYEHLKHTGELPIIGVNTFFPNHHSDGSSKSQRLETQLIRASYEEKDEQLARLAHFHMRHQDSKTQALKALKEAALANKNVFAELMHTVRHCSLGEITKALFEIGGEYRRSM